MRKSAEAVTRMGEAKVSSRHISALDGVRGLAALGVAMSHLFAGKPQGAMQTATAAVFRFGATGVDLFFVLSGFLITGILLDSVDGPRFFRTFYARRALRIFPLYYMVLGAFAVAALIFGWNFHGELLSLALYLQNTSLIAKPLYLYKGPDALPLSHFWSLAIEEQFYLVWPFAVWVLRRRERLMWVCAAFTVVCPVLRYALAAHGAGYLEINTNVLCRVDSLLAGAALAMALRTTWSAAVLRAGRWLLPAGLMLGVGLMIAAPSSAPEHPWAMAFTDSGWAMAGAGTLCMALLPGAVQRLFSTAPLRALGRYSYGFYVYHLILFELLREPLKSLLLAAAHSKVVATLGSGVIIFALTFGVAWLSFHTVESRFLRWKRLFEYREV